MNTESVALQIAWVFDPGHEWLEVTGDSIDLEVAAMCATGYDYRNYDGTRVYLEGDLSAAIYLHALNYLGQRPDDIADQVARDLRDGTRATTYGAGVISEVGVNVHDLHERELSPRNYPTLRAGAIGARVMSIMFDNPEVAR